MNDLATTPRPDLAAELVGTDPATVHAGTRRVLLWACPNHDAPYPASGHARIHGSGCGYCHGLRVLVGYNDLATTHRDLAAELVGTDPTAVVAGTHRTLLWRCPNHDAPYPSTGADRVGGRGCGFCSGDRVLPGYNDLATTRPDLAAELVGTDPTTVTAGTRRTLLWRCPRHAEPYPATGLQRSHGQGCGYCRGKRVLPGYNDLATRHPALAAELVGTDPTTVTSAGRARLLWRCRVCGEEWHATLSSRTTSGTGCPSCAVSGFDPNKPAHLYLMARHGEQQVGITGDLRKRTTRHGRAGWVLVDSMGPIPGVVAAQEEARVKAWLARHVGTLAGTTENWSTAALEVSSLADLLALVKVSDSPG